VVRITETRTPLQVPLLAEHGNTRKSFITHALVSKVVSFSFITHHFCSSFILDCASIFLLLFHFIHYKNLMCTTFSVVESIPPFTSRRRRPVFFSSPPVVTVSFSRPVVKISQAPLTRSTPVHVHARSVYARPVQLTRSYLRSRPVSSSRRAPQFTTHTSTFRFHRSTDSVQYLSQTTAEILAPPFAQHTPREFLIRFSDRQVSLHSSRIRESALARVSPQTPIKSQQSETQGGQVSPQYMLRILCSKTNVVFVQVTCPKTAAHPARKCVCTFYSSEDKDV